MGGLGSGRPGSGKLTVEVCWSLDVNRLRKAGVLDPGWFGGWSWSRNGQKVASVAILGGTDRIVLSYRVKVNGGDWQDVEEPVRILWSPCRYGGERAYFACPGIVDGRICGRRAEKLYAAGRHYLCRHCYRLTYASRSEDRYDRALRRANKIRMRLGGEPGAASPLPERPKGMWRRTYEMLMSDVAEAEDTADERLILLAAKFLTSDAKRQKKEFWG